MGRFRNARSAPTTVQDSCVAIHVQAHDPGGSSDAWESRTTAAVQLGPSHPILAWAVRHAAWLLARFQVKSSDTTSAMFPVWTRVLGLFGETVCYKFGGAQGKLLPRWEEGVYVGIKELTGEHLNGDKRAHAA